MGCDIHVCVEILRTVNNTEEWFNYDHFRYNPYFSEDDPDEEELEHVPIYSDRDYLLFTRLCGVREYSLIRTIQLCAHGEEFSYQETKKASEPKGIPDDCSKITKGIIERWGSDGHSHSYLTLKEIIDYIDSKPPKKHEGFLSDRQVASLAKGDDPDSWSNIKTPKAPHFKQWDRPWDESIDSGIIELAEAIKLRALEYYYSYQSIEPEKVRIVFFFDN